MPEVHKAIQITDSGFSHQETTPISRSFSRHAANACIGLVLCYGLLFGVAEMRARQAAQSASQQAHEFRAHDMPGADGLRPGMSGANPEERAAPSLALREFEAASPDTVRYDQSLKGDERREVDSLTTVSVRAESTHAASIAKASPGLATAQHEAGLVNNLARKVSSDRQAAANESAAPAHAEPRSSPDTANAKLASAFEEQRLKSARYREALQGARQEIDNLKIKSSNISAPLEAAVAQTERRLAAEQQKVLALDNLAKKAKVESERIAAHNVAQLQARDNRLADISRAYDEQRLRAGRLSQALGAAQRDFDVAKAAHDNATGAAQRERDAANAAKSRAEEMLLRVRQQHIELTRGLDDMRQNWEQAVRTGGVERSALQHERDKVATLQEDLRAARKEIERLKARNVQRVVRAEPSNAAVPNKKRAARPQMKPKAVKTSGRRAEKTAQLLPASLLPTRPPLPD